MDMALLDFPKNKPAFPLGHQGSVNCLCLVRNAGVRNGALEFDKAFFKILAWTRELKWTDEGDRTGLQVLKFSILPSDPDALIVGG